MSFRSPRPANTCAAWRTISKSIPELTFNQLKGLMRPEKKALFDKGDALNRGDAISSIQVVDPFASRGNWKVKAEEPAKG